MPVSLNANALVSLASMKIFLKIPSATLTEDDLVSTFINDVSSLVESYCNRQFREQTRTEFHDGSGISEILLKQWPVTAITSFWVDPSRIFGSETLVDPANYQIGCMDNGEGYTLERFDGGNTRGRKVLKVTYVAGYASLALVPGDLQLATKRTVAYYWKQQQNMDFTETNKSKGDENITLIDGLPLAATQILDNYRRLEMVGDTNALYNT